MQERKQVQFLLCASAYQMHCKCSYQAALLEETGEGIDVSRQMVRAASTAHGFCGLLMQRE